MAIPGGNPFLAPNPYLTNVLSALPSGKAAFSQDLGQILFNFSGQALPTVSYPQWNPFGNWQGGILPGFMGLGLA